MQASLARRESNSLQFIWMSGGSAASDTECLSPHHKEEPLAIAPDAAHYYDFCGKFVAPSAGCASCKSDNRPCRRCMERLEIGFESLRISSLKNMAGTPAGRTAAGDKGKIDTIENRPVLFRFLAANMQLFGLHESCDAELRLEPEAETPKLELGMITKIANHFHVRVCIYRCSLMIGIQTAADQQQLAAENSDVKQRRDYQKVIRAMRNNDLKIIGPPSAPRVVYCMYCRSDTGIGYLHQLPDIADESFWLDEVTVSVTVSSGGSGSSAPAKIKQKTTATCCSLCTWAYPTLNDAILHKEAGDHIRTVSHRRALQSAVLLHALHNFGGLLKDKPEKEREKLSAQDLKFKFPFSDIIFWYLHHDRVPHKCEGEKIITEVLNLYLEAKEPSSNIGKNLHLLIAICKELNLSRVICQELARKNKEYTVLKKMVEKKMPHVPDVEKTSQEVAAEKMSDISAFCDIDLGMECLFQSNFFDSFQKVEHDFPIKFLVEMLNECDKVQTLSRNFEASHLVPKMSSFPTKQWILHTTGRSVKLHGHGVKHVYETCEVEKTSNVYERWRHLIYSYALCSLLWNEFNGNKEGPIGIYPQRRNQCLGSIGRHSLATPSSVMQQTELNVGDYAKLRSEAGAAPPRTFSQISQHDVGEVCEIFGEGTGIDGHCRIRFNEYTYFCPTSMLEKVGPAQRECVYASKENGEPLNYVGHNIVAFAVGKRGDILRVAYNHNVLFTSTVDHAEERLIDSLYRDPTAFVQKSHSEILDEKETIDVEKHMQHISVYTSLEPCQQCSGKMHVALVPEVIFCQRDWDIQLMQVEMYEKFRKTRSVPASYFNFPPYEQLATSYYEFQRLIDEDKPSFFQSFKPSGAGLGSKTDVVAKKTMPYFLCTDDCQDVFQRGDYAFKELLKVLFCSSDETSIKDALDEFVLFHGLNEHCRSDWYLDKEAIDSLRIRNFRPTLNYKHQRIMHDELIAKRQQWIQLRHRLSCSVTITFSSRWRDGANKPVSENMVDMYLSPLADIVSVYIPRELNGLLKGSFKVTCVNRDAAVKLHDLLKNSYDNPSKFTDDSVRGSATREAVKWLRAIQATDQPTPKVRIDIEHLPRERPIPAFALTANADVVDTKIRKYFDHLCSFSFKEFKMKSGQEKRAPLTLRIFDVPWQTCLNRMWINFEGKDNNFALAKRRIWTVEFPSSSLDVRNLYESVDFTPDNILDEYTQPYTQPIFDHTWFCACDEAFHNRKLSAGARIVITDIGLPCVIGTPSEDDLRSLIQAIDSNLQIPAGHHIMSCYVPSQKGASRLKSGESGVLLFSGRRLNNEEREYFPVRLDSDYSIHFLSAKCFKVISSTHARVCWQPPALPLNLFNSDEGSVKKKPFCFLKIVTTMSKYLQKPNDKALPNEEHDKGAQDILNQKCKDIFPPPAVVVTEKSTSKKSPPVVNEKSQKSKKSEARGGVFEEVRQCSGDSPVELQSPPLPRLFSASFCDSPTTPASGTASESDQALSVGASCTSLFIHDLENTVTEHDLRRIFSAFGTISSVVLSKKTLGYAYVYFSDHGAMESLNQKDKDDVFVIRGKRLHIMQMQKPGDTPRVSEYCTSHSKTQWKLEVLFDDLKAHCDNLTQNGGRGNMLLSCLLRMKEFFDTDEVRSSFDKFHRTLGTFGKMLDLDIHVIACSEISLFVTVSEASSSSQLFHVTSEMYELFEDNIDGSSSYTFCGYVEKLKKNSGAGPMRFEISDRSLATILASDMLQTPKGRHQVFALLKRAQDDPSKKLDWWNEKHPVKIGADVDLKKLISFLADKFVRSSFNFAVKLCVAPKAVGISSKNECMPVSWLDKTVRLTGPQLVQYVVQYSISQKNVRSPSFLKDVKAVLNELRDLESSAAAVSSEEIESRLKVGLENALKRLKPRLSLAQATHALCRERIEHETCDSSICMNCQCKCSFSSAFKGPIQDLLMKHDSQSKLYKHLSYHLNPALKGKSVRSNCSKILSDIKSFGHYIKATLDDLLRDVDKFESKMIDAIANCDAVASSSSAGSVHVPGSDVTDFGGDDAASSFATFSSDSSHSSLSRPKYLSRFSPKSIQYVRTFLKTLNLECEVSDSASALGGLTAGRLSSCSDVENLCQRDILGSSSIQIHDAENDEALGSCLVHCRAAKRIVFQIRQRYDSTSCCLLQLCCFSDDIYQVFLVRLPVAIYCEQMVDLIDVLCRCELLLCFSESSENMLKSLSVSFGRQLRSDISVLQKILKPTYFGKEPGLVSFKDLIRRTFGKTWNDTWNHSGWDVFPLHADQSKYAALEVLATFRIFDLHVSKTLTLRPESPPPVSNPRQPKKEDPYEWSRVQSCCSEVTKSMDRKLEISRPPLAPKMTARNEDPVKEPNASNLLHRICELERLLLLELSTSRLSFIHEQHFSSGITSDAVFLTASAVARGEHESFNVASPPRSSMFAGDGLTSSNFGLQLIIRRQRYDSCPSVSEQQDCIKSGKSYVRFCIDGPLMQFSDGVQVTLKMKLPNDKDLGIDMEAEMNVKSLDIVEFKLDQKKKERGYGRVYGCIPEIDNDILLMLFDPEYNFDPRHIEESGYPFLEVSLQVGSPRKTLKAHVHSFHFKEFVDASVLKCIELHKNLNSLRLRQKDLENVYRMYSTLRDGLGSNEDNFKHLKTFLEKPEVVAVVNFSAKTSQKDVEKTFSGIFQRLREYTDANQKERLRIFMTLRNELENGGMPLRACGHPGQSTATSALEKFKFFLRHDIDLISQDIVGLLCHQGKQLERSCQFYFALKYYFAGLQYFLKMKKEPLNEEMTKIYRRFVSLFQNLLPLSNSQVYEQARSTAEFQRGVMRRGTMMK